ncbi:hypothetical protein [Thermosediminibacter oceani]|uniref:DUF5668 domain-containing protein n=1 Tax=Thermosediminibacter oceani (strain ATCC BAA-1034 / DSM 16646 / JW/IW-1228P) TaxID=555079 RepID=D9S147_THEOJ|nr:hypothetical protein [Thermosediminibacter oceani]ADL08926.1 hypothetical protein Toce_2214 [Thermosediminibacter oceani DSM 16646]
MRKWKVGSISLGTLLVAAGVTLLASEIFGRDAAFNAVKWWPLVPIVLGAEVLLYSFLNKGEPVDFDFFSILVICFAGLFTLGLYGLWETGIIPAINQTISSQNFVLAAEPEKMQIDGTVAKIIIEGPACELTLRPVSEKAVTVFGSASVVADSRERAEELLSASDVVFDRSGEILRISFDTPRRHKSFGFYAEMTSYTLHVPENIDVEVINRGSLKIRLDKINSNWLIENSGHVDVIVKDSADVKVKAMVDSKYLLGGNTDWKVIGESEKDTFLQKSLFGEVIFGKGEHTVNVIGGKVTVNSVE